MSTNMIFSVGQLDVKEINGVYECVAAPLENIGDIPMRASIDMEDFHDFIDFLVDNCQSTALVDHLLNDFSISSTRRALTSFFSNDCHYTSKLSQLDVNLFDEVYDLFREEIVDMPDDAVVSIHPTLRKKYNSLKILMWFKIVVKAGVYNCTRPVMSTYQEDIGEEE